MFRFKAISEIFFQVVKIDFENITVSYSDKIGILTLDRPDKLNVMAVKAVILLIGVMNVNLEIVLWKRE